MRVTVARNGGACQGLFRGVGGTPVKQVGAPTLMAVRVEFLPVDNEVFELFTAICALTYARQGAPT